MRSRQVSSSDYWFAVLALLALAGRVLAACPDPLAVATFEPGDTAAYAGLFSRQRLAVEFLPRLPMSRSRFGTGRDGFAALVTFEGNASLGQCLWETGGRSVGSWIGLVGDTLRLRAGDGRRLFGAARAPGVAKCEANVSHLLDGGMHLIEWLIDAPRGVVALWADGRELCWDSAFGGAPLGMPPLPTPGYSGRDAAMYGNCAGSTVPNGESTEPYAGAVSALSFYNDVSVDEVRPAITIANVSRFGVGAGTLGQEVLLGPFQRPGQTGFVLDLWVMFTDFARGNNSFATLEYALRYEDTGPALNRYATSVYVTAQGRVAVKDSYSGGVSALSGRVPVDNWVRVTVTEQAGVLRLFLNRFETGSCAGPAFEPPEFLLRLGGANRAALHGYVDAVTLFGSGSADVAGIWRGECAEVPPPPPPPPSPPNGTVPRSTSAPFTSTSVPGTTVAAS